jgi:hypothetical protein
MAYPLYKSNDLSCTAGAVCCCCCLCYMHILAICHHITHCNCLYINTQAAIDDIRLMQEYKERMDKEENDRAAKLRYVVCIYPSCKSTTMYLCTTIWCYNILLVMMLAVLPEVTVSTQ